MGERLLAGEKPNADGPGVVDLSVGEPLDLFNEVDAHLLEFEVHACGEGSHVAAGYVRAEVAPDDAAEDVEGGVGPHELVAVVPVDLAAHVAARLRSGALDGVPDVAVAPLHRGYGERAGACFERSDVARLAASSGEEGGAVESDEVAVDRGHAGVELPGIGVVVKDGVRHVRSGGRHEARDGGHVRGLVEPPDGLEEVFGLGLGEDFAGEVAVLGLEDRVGHGILGGAGCVLDVGGEGASVVQGDGEVYLILADLVVDRCVDLGAEGGDDWVGNLGVGELGVVSGAVDERGRGAVLEGELALQPASGFRAVHQFENEGVDAGVNRGDVAGLEVVLVAEPDDGVLDGGARRRRWRRV